MRVKKKNCENTQVKYLGVGGRKVGLETGWSWGRRKMQDNKFARKNRLELLLVYIITAVGKVMMAMVVVVA